MHKNEAIKIAAPLFDSYPSVDTFHVAEDKQAFEHEHTASSHARSIHEKSKIVSVDRTDVAEVETAKDKVVTPVTVADKVIKPAVKKVVPIKKATAPVTKKVEPAKKEEPALAKTADPAIKA